MRIVFESEQTVKCLNEIEVDETELREWFAAGANPFEGGLDTIPEGVLEDFVDNHLDRVIEAGSNVAQEESWNYVIEED